MNLNDDVLRSTIALVIPLRKTIMIFVTVLLLFVTQFTLSKSEKNHHVRIHHPISYDLIRQKMIDINHPSTQMEYKNNNQLTTSHQYITAGTGCTNLRVEQMSLKVNSHATTTMRKRRRKRKCLTSKVFFCWNDYYS